MASNVPRLVPTNVSSHSDVSMLQSPRTISSPLPIREQLGIDPLLANLSPGSVLEALRTTNATLLTSASKEQLLADSISEASSHERALGIRAALAGKRIRDWTVELQAWTWPEETFQPPADSPHDEYWGSLPIKVVLEREIRLESIKDGLALLETEDLKNYVRNIHLQSPPRKMSQDSSHSPGSTPYNRLADFNVLITAIIMQSLPDLAILTRLLSSWSLRISVSRQIPKFLQQLWEAKLGLESAWITLEQAARPGTGLVLTEETYEQIKEMLEDRVTEMAKSIDAILDALEGSEDCIPDHWIDDVEEAESNFKDWIVEAERLVRLYQWQTSKLDPEIAPIAISPEQIPDHGLRSTSITNDITTSFDESNDILTGLGATTAKSLDAIQESRTESTLNPLDPTLDTYKGTITESDIPELTTKQTFSHVTSQFSLLHAHPTESPDFGVGDQSITLPSSTKVRSSIDIAQEFTPPKSPNDDDTIDDNDAYDVPEEVENLPSISSINHSTADHLISEHPMSSSDPSPRIRIPSLHSRSMVHDNVTDSEPRQSTEQTITSEFLVQQQIERLQQELDDDASKDPEFMDQSPSLMVRKVRLPLEQHTIADRPPVNIAQATQPIEDKMTAKISRLLTNIPAPIQLAIHPLRAETGLGTEGKSVSRPQLQTTSTPALTLSPVTTKAKSTKSNDLGVRVYHLHQPGREIPIKLFIRLVGNEERVMVRVGGGWADLAEYLKEYAIHHGRRSVSNNKFELDGLPSAQSAANSILDANRSPSSSTVGTPTRRPATPQLDWTSEPHTPEPVRQAESIPVSGDSNRFHPGPNSSVQEDDNLSLGLGGPKSKKIELSPQKRAWVDGMLGQARQISSEHKKTDDIGDLGKVGNTKRVFLRGRGDSFTPK